MSTSSGKSLLQENHSNWSPCLTAGLIADTSSIQCQRCSSSSRGKAAHHCPSSFSISHMLTQDSWSPLQRPDSDERFLYAAESKEHAGGLPSWSSCKSCKGPDLQTHLQLSLTTLSLKNITYQTLGGLHAIVLFIRKSQVSFSFLGGTTHESHFTRSASQGEDLRGSKQSRCTRPSTAPVHHMPTPGVSGASHHILKRLPRRQFSFRDSSYLLLQASAGQGESSDECCACESTQAPIAHSWCFGQPQHSLKPLK